MMLKKVLSVVLSVQMVAMSAFAGVDPKTTQEEIEQKVAAVNIKEMSDEQILSALQEIQTLINARQEQLSSASAKNDLRTDKKQRVVALTIGAVAILGFVVGNKAVPNSGMQALGYLGGLFGIFGAGGIFLSSSNGDKVLAKLHDTDMTAVDISLAYRKLEPISERIEKLKNRIEIHLSVERERAS